MLNGLKNLGNTCYMNANEEKLVSEKKRWMHGDKMSDDTSSDSDSDDRKLNDDVNNYRKLNSSSNASESNSQSNSQSHSHTQNTDTQSGPRVFDSENYSHKDGNSHNGGYRDLTKEELRRKKLDFLRKFIDLRNAGVEISKNYGMHSDLSEMEDEYNLHVSIRSKSNALNIISHLMVGVVSGLETLNDNYNPFDIKLSGLSRKINDDMTHYYDVLGEIYEKYNSPGKSIAPELKLLMMIGGAALQLQMGKLIPNMIRGQADKINKDPKLISDLAEKASKESSSHREKLNSVMEKDRNIMRQKMDDNKYLREKELELDKIRSQDISSIKELEISESMGRSSKSSEKQMLYAKNLAKKQQLQDLEMNMKRDSNKKSNSPKKTPKPNPTMQNIADEEARLKKLMNQIQKENDDDDDDNDDDDNDDDDDDDDDNQTNSSTSSTLSKNPGGFRKLIEKNKNKYKTKINKGDISIGSSRNKKSSINITSSKK